MTFIKIGSATLIVAALSACGGAGGGGGDDDFSFEVSNGIISDVEVPTGDTLDALPREAVAVVNGFRAFNEANDPASSVPLGDATYDGEFAFGFEGDNDAIVTGNMFMTINFQDSRADGSMNNITVYDDDGFQIATNAGLLTIRGETPSDQFTASAQGNVEVEGETYGVDAALRGAFGGAEAVRGIGTIAGIVTNPDSTTDGIDGLYILNKQ